MKKKNPLSIQDISFRTERGGSSYNPLTWSARLNNYRNRSRVYPSYRGNPLGFRICRTTQDSSN